MSAASRTARLARPALTALAALPQLPFAGPLDFVTRNVSDSASTYLVVIVIVALDSFVPIAPSETLVIAASVIAVHGQLAIWVIVLAAWIGAVLGDNVSFWLGNRLGDRAAPRLFRGEKGKRALGWAERELSTRPWIILVARFLPGGRTATTFAAGWVQLPWKRFMTFDVPAGLLWAAYAGALGYIGGEAFRHSLWKALLVALAIAAVITTTVEGYRFMHKHRQGDGDGDGAVADARSRATACERRRSR